MRFWVLIVFVLMVEKNSKLPAIVWLRMTDYMHAWLQYELGGSLHVKNQKVISVQHLSGARDVLRMETVEEALPQRHADKSMSPTWRNAVEAGMGLDPDVMRRDYGVTREILKLFTPVECPRMTLTQNGVLRPWGRDTNFSNRQAAAMQDLLRREFWRAVGEFAEKYACEHQGEKYAQADMIEAFCKETKTPDVYVEAMRREWQRRCKRQKS